VTTASGAVSPYKLASVLLGYPTASLFAGLDQLDDVAAGTSPKPARQAFGAFISWLRASSPADVAQHYVATFDLRRRCALYLTYYRHGDTRNRGMAMLAFSTAYRTAGFEPTAADLPDYLPAVLEFAALHPTGETLLRRHRADLELLRAALHRAETPYAGLVDAVGARLGRPGRRDLALIRAWRDREPPAEQVGLAPFAPPEYLSGAGQQ
jgi:nitrate reductase delta subunit